MAVRYVTLGIVGMAVALIGILKALYPLVALGVVLIIAAFFWFSSTNQGTPAPGKGNDSIPTG